jgi:hypothetical protein
MPADWCFRLAAEGIKSHAVIFFFSMKSAAFSAIVTAGQFVLPDGNVGIAEQSTACNPVTPRTTNITCMY